MRFSIFFLLLFLPLVPALQITEIESNPSGTDAGNEWMELYSDEEINLENYLFINHDGNELIIDASFEGYFVYIFPTQWLDNSNESISIYKDGELIDETPIFDDSSNDGNTFSLCEEWIFQEATKGEKNCEKIIEIENSTEKKSIPEKEPIKIKEESIPVQKIINLNPKTIKTEETTSNVKGSWILKYSFGIFCVLLLLLYVIKPKRRKNEWRNKSNSNVGY
jgi:hypothetical protein